jgi:hypothetical protein
MVVAAAVSYQTQRGLFLAWSVDSFTAAIAPIAIDLLAIICTLAIHADGVAREGRKAAIVVLVITGSGSLTANFLAGHTLGSKAVHAAMVALYLLAEWIAAQVKAPPVPAAEPYVAPEPRKWTLTQTEKDARKRAGYASKDRAGKAEWTRAYRERITRRAQTSPGYGPVQAPSAADLEDAVR